MGERKTENKTGPQKRSRGRLSNKGTKRLYIQFQYLGAGPMYFWTEDPDTGVPFRFHTIGYANANTTPSTYNPNYHMTFYVDNALDERAQIDIEDPGYGSGWIPTYHAPPGLKWTQSTNRPRSFGIRFGQRF